MREFRKFFEALEKENIRYLVVGGVAVNLYGIERATGDIDISLDMKQENLARFINVIKELGFKPNVPVKIDDLADAVTRQKWITDKGMVVLSIFDPKNAFFTLDVLVEQPFDFDKVFKDRNKIRAWDMSISVISLKDLIKMKEKTGRPQDKADAFYLKKVKKELADEK